MSQVPFYFPRGQVYGHVNVKDGILLDGLTDVYDGIHMGLCAENTAFRDNITREDQDNFAIESYQPTYPSIRLPLFPCYSQNLGGLLTGTC
jgi:acetyl-CoA C-acetyltransferase